MERQNVLVRTTFGNDKEYNDKQKKYLEEKKKCKTKNHKKEKVFCDIYCLKMEQMADKDLCDRMKWTYKGMDRKVVKDLNVLLPEDEFGRN